MVLLDDCNLENALQRADILRRAIEIAEVSYQKDKIHITIITILIMREIELVKLATTARLPLKREVNSGDNDDSGANTTTALQRQGPGPVINLLNSNV